MQLRVLMADDEAMARKRLVRLLVELPDVEVVSVCDSGDAALTALETLEIDLAILDIQMPGLSGLEVSTAASELGVEVVFASAHSEHAVLAFERGAADYVMKPIDPARLALAVERARARLERPDAAASTLKTKPLERLAITTRGEVRLLAPSDIAHALLDGELVRLKVGDEELWTELSLQDLERRLEASGFVRVHRRALLNLAHVDRLRPLPTGGYVALTRSGDEVPVSRQEARRLRQRLGI